MLDWGPRAEIKQSARVRNLLCEVGNQLRNKAERAVTREAKWGQNNNLTYGRAAATTTREKLPYKILPMMTKDSTNDGSQSSSHADRVCHWRDRCSSATFQLLSNCTEKVELDIGEITGQWQMPSRVFKFLVRECFTTLLSWEVNGCNVV